MITFRRKRLCNGVEWGKVYLAEGVGMGRWTRPGGGGGGGFAFWKLIKFDLTRRVTAKLLRWSGTADLPSDNFVRVNAI